MLTHTHGQANLKPYGYGYFESMPTCLLSNITTHCLANFAYIGSINIGLVSLIVRSPN